MSHFVAPSVQARQAARESPAAAAAAWLVVALLLLQLPFWFWLEPATTELVEAEKRESARLAGLKAALEARGRALDETRRQLAEIRRLEPVLEARLPAAAVLAQLERTIPPEMVCSRIRLAAEQFAPTPGGQRVATSHALRLEGFQNKGDRVELLKWANALLAGLPQGSGIVTAEFTPGVTPPDRFLLVVRIAGQADWSRLGLSRIPIENP